MRIGLYHRNGCRWRDLQQSFPVCKNRLILRQIYKQMNVQKKELSPLHILVNIELTKDDYAGKVEKELKEYRKKAVIPGFRKGKAPMGLIKKQYETTLIVHEVNELVQEALRDFIEKEKIEYLGEPLPADSDFDLEKNVLSFGYEFGLIPEFEIDLDTRGEVVLYDLKIDKKTWDKEVMHLRNHYGTYEPAEEISEDSKVSGHFEFEYKDEKQKKEAEFHIRDLTPEAKKKFLGKKTGAVLEYTSGSLFAEPHTLMHVLQIDRDDVHHFDVPLTFTVSGIHDLTPAEMNEEFFKKATGDDTVTDEKTFRERFTGTLTAEYKRFTDQKFFDDMISYITGHTSFDLPEAFLKKWMKKMSFGKGELKEDALDLLYEDSVDGLRYQLIENKILQENGLDVTNDMIFEQIKANFKSLYKKYGVEEPAEEILDKVAKEYITDSNNKQELDDVYERIKNDRLLTFFKEKAVYKTQKIEAKEFFDMLREIAKKK